MTTDRLRTTLAAAALAASVSIAGVASAHESKGSGKHGAGKAKPCKAKGKGYEVQGAFAHADLEQVAGAATSRTNDDRFSGTVVVRVEKGNRRGRRDLGLSSYAVTGVRVIGAAADGTLPAEGSRVQLVGKQLTAKQARSCEPAPTTPEPTTPEPTTPTEPEPTATLSGRPGGGGPKVEESSEVDETDEVVASEDDASADDAKADDDARSDEDLKSGDDDSASDDRKHGRPKTGDGDAADDDDADGAEVVDEEPTAVTDVAIRVVHFKVRPSAARR